MLVISTEKGNIVRILFECHILLEFDLSVLSLLHITKLQNNGEVANEITTDRLSEFPEFHILLN